MLGRSATELSWAAEGHFLLFAVIARADGKDFGDEDTPHVRVIVYDVLEKYLRDGAIGTWSIDKASAQPPTGDPKPSGAGG